MAKKLKDYYDLNSAIQLADKILKVYAKFDKEKFIKIYEKEYKKKEFFERQDLFVKALEETLPKNYKKNIKIFYKILGPELPASEGMFIYGWFLWPISRYVEKYGIQDFQTSMDFIYELTKRFTGEFAIRPLIKKYPKPALKIILKWSKDKNVHVRRLASEGIRIKLPWAKKMTVALEEFKTYKKILTNLRKDKEKFVQRSVGNNLNDLMKEQPILANEIILEWQNNNPSKETLWIIKHGMRSLRKKKTK